MDGETNRRKLHTEMHTSERNSSSDSNRNASAHLVFLFVASIALLSTFSAVSVRASTELYTQTMFRPQERSDRPHGTFHESRLRYSFGTDLQIDLGSYLLAEWTEMSATSSSSTNTAVSPYAGMRWHKAWSMNSTAISLTAIFEGRYREPLGDFSRSIGANGWDPRTGLAFGVWHQFEQKVFNGRPFADVYADMFYAPKYGSALLSTLIGRLGNRYSLPEVAAEGQWSTFADYYLEVFRQNASSIELGTRREEARLGLAIGGSHSNGTLQLRVFHGWPLSSSAGVADMRPRTEALLIGGITL